jgi:hypothetical protein
MRGFGTRWIDKPYYYSALTSLESCIIPALCIVLAYLLITSSVLASSFLLLDGFVTQVLYDIGVVDHTEPFTSLVHQGDFLSIISLESSSPDLEFHRCYIITNC